jgi:pantetheine-phosphate adenylyltransferase
VQTVLYPGTFGPMTNGHLDIVERALHLFERVIILVADNPNKQPIFSADERVRLIREAVQPLAAAERLAVDSYRGLTIDYAHKVGAGAMIRGLRAVTDFEWEFQLALINQKLEPAIETVCLMTSQEHSFLSASMIRELAQYGGNLEGLVPPNVETALRRVYGVKREHET